MFLIGIISYTLIHPVFSKPLYSYVIGHELTHVIGVWLFRGRIHKLSISKHGGMVKADKTNILIKLLPYFFPIYTFLVLGIYLLLSIAWDFTGFANILAFVLGVTWAFHIWMTVYILRKNQPDVRDSGIIFSLVIIYLFNIIILSLLLVFISPELTFKNCFTCSLDKVRECYLWIIQKIF